MEPFLKWAGSKRWLIPKLIDKLPPFKTYYEPFVGSGGLFFALEPKRAILSDSNPELISCYRRVRDHCQDVIKVLKRLRPNKITYYRVRNELYPRGDRIQRAAYFIFLNKTCWNGLYRVNLEGRFNVPIGSWRHPPKIFDPEQLLIASRLLKRTKLKCCDFEDAVTELKKGDLVYFDPPYITTHLNNGFFHYNSKLFHHSDELRLARVAHYLTMKGVSVAVSNAAHPLIRQQYDGPFFKTEIDRHSTIAADVNHRSKIKELLVTSFPFHAP
jgi:DNA adenine methylase